MAWRGGARLGRARNKGAFLRNGKKNGRGGEDMALKRFAVKLTGETPLLLHNDNVEWADFMEAWRKGPGQQGLIPSRG